jgi:hypothetical protein
MRETPDGLPPAPTPVSVTGRFKFDSADDLKRIRDRIQKEVLDKLITARTKIDPLTSVQGPGKDFASQDQAVEYNAHGETYRGQHENVVTFTQAYVDNFSKVIGDYVATEDANNTSIKSQGDGI